MSSSAAFDRGLMVHLKGPGRLHGIQIHENFNHNLLWLTRGCHFGIPHPALSTTHPGPLP